MPWNFSLRLHILIEENTLENRARDILQGPVGSDEWQVGEEWEEGLRYLGKMEKANCALNYRYGGIYTLVICHRTYFLYWFQNLSRGWVWLHLTCLRPIPWCMSVTALAELLPELWQMCIWNDRQLIAEYFSITYTFRSGQANLRLKISSYLFTEDQLCSRPWAKCFHRSSLLFLKTTLKLTNMKITVLTAIKTWMQSEDKQRQFKNLIFPSLHLEIWWLS